MTGDKTLERHLPSRRTVVRGAAWAIPTVAVASTAPAFAASCPPGSCTAVGFGSYISETATTSWTSVSNGSWENKGASNPVGFQNAANVSFAAAAEPSSSGRTIVLTRTANLAPTADCRTLRVDISAWTRSGSSLTLTAKLGTTALGGSYTTVTDGVGTSVRQPAVFTIPANATTGQLTMTITFNGGKVAHHDIFLSNPVLSCN